MLSILVQFLVIVIGAVFIVSTHSKEKQRIENIIKDTGKRLKLNVITGSFGSKLSLFGKIGDIIVEVNVFRYNLQKCFKVYCHYHVKDRIWFKIYHRSMSFQALKILNYGKTETGDSEFDSNLLSTTNHAELLPAYLNQKARCSILELKPKVIDFEISEKEFSATSTAYIDDYETLVKITSSIVEIAKHFSNPISIKDRLIENLWIETDITMRLKNMHALAMYWKLDDQIVSALEKVLKDKDLRMQIKAATYLGAQSMPHLVNILKTESHLNEKLITDIILALRKHKYTPSMTILKLICRQTRYESVYMEIMKAFKSFGDSKLMDFLLEQLESHSVYRRISAIEALGTCGTVDAVEKLYLVSKGSLNPSLRKAASKSIDLIQTRLGQVEKGWLSVSELADKQGALSIDAH